ncbi:hypothetical protein M9458_006605, partial [Cirrhinus mrigala]
PCSLGSSPLRRSRPTVCDVASSSPTTSPSAGFWPPAWWSSTPAGNPPALLHWTSG